MIRPGGLVALRVSQATLFAGGALRMNWLLVGIFSYLVIQFAVGIWVSKRIKNESDYIVAGRALGLGLAAFSIFATWFGAESIQGAAGEIYTDGFSGGSSDPFGYVLCIVFMGLVFAGPLWSRGFTTFGDLFRQRYSVTVERFAIVLMVPTSIFWGAAQIRAFGNVIADASTIPLPWCITGAAVFVLLYTVVGGLLADAWTDLLQGIALAVGLAILLGVLLAKGDLQAAWQQVPPNRLHLLGDPNTPWYITLENWAVPVVGSVLAVELISRILGCKSASTARNACFFGAGMYLAVGLIPAVIGLCGPHLAPNLEHPEQLIPNLAQQHLGTFLYILFAGALISGILSTVDSTLLAGSALLSHNILLGLKPDISDRGKLLAARGGVMLLGSIAFVLAIVYESIGDLVETSSAFGSAGIFVVGTFGLFTRIGGPVSALCTLAVGMAVWGAGHFFLDWDTPFIIALTAAFATYVVTSFFSKPPMPNVQNPVFNVQNADS